MKAASFCVLSILCAFASIADAQPVKLQRVAILFNGDDPDPESPLGRTFHKNELEGVRLYKAAGFDRIVVLSRRGDETMKATAQNLTREISSLKGTGELHVHFISHGSGQPIPSPAEGEDMGMMEVPAEVDSAQGDAAERDRDFVEYSRRYTEIPLTQRESRLYSEFQSLKGNYKRSVFSIVSSEEGGADPIYSNNVGIGDLKEALDTAQKSNPDMTTALYTGACYSGSLARAFAEVPKTHTYVASQAVLYAWGISPEFETNQDVSSDTLISYDELLQNHLRKGESFLSAHAMALREYLKIVNSKSGKRIRLNSQLSATIPRSGPQEYLINWCLKNQSHLPAADNGRCQDKRAVEHIATVNGIVEEYNRANPELVLCNQNAATLDEIKQARSAILERAYLFTKERLDKPVPWPEAYERYLGMLNDAAETFGEEEEKTKGFSNVKTDLKKAQAWTASEREKKMAEIHKGALQNWQQDYDACVLGQLRGYLNDCNPYNIVARLESAQTIWTKDPGRHSAEHEDKLREKCLRGAKRKDTDLVKIRCLAEASVEYPLEALSATRSLTYGKSCPLYKLAAEGVEEDKACFKKYLLSADCKDWARMSELMDLGSRSLVSKVTSASPRGSKEGAK